jgi:uncharacterized protein
VRLSSIAAVALSVTVLPALPLSAAARAQTGAAEPVGTPVHDDGMVATWYPPASGKRGPVLLVLGGSEGGERGSQRVAAAFARQGYGVLALAWFKAPGLPEQLQEIPLEYFGRAITWLQHQPLADPDRIGLYGISKGGEAALLLASTRPEIKAVIAAVPSSVVWQGINQANYMDVKSSFSLNGKPVAYLPYDSSQPFTSVLDLYQRSLATLAAHQDAVIPVERIHGPMLLLSGKADALWPSSAMSDQVIARLDAKGFRYPHSHIAYPDAGHGATVPLPAGAPTSGYTNMGGTDAGNAFARSDSWARMLRFFDQSLGGPAK